MLAIGDTDIAYLNWVECGHAYKFSDKSMYYQEINIMLSFVLFKSPEIPCESIFNVSLRYVEEYVAFSLLMSIFIWNL